MPNILGGDEVLELLKKHDTLPPSCGSGSLAYCCATAFNDWRAMIVSCQQIPLTRGNAQTGRLFLRNSLDHWSPEAGLKVKLHCSPTIDSITTIPSLSLSSGISVDFSQEKV